MSEEIYSQPSCSTPLLGEAVSRLDRPLSYHSCQTNTGDADIKSSLLGQFTTQLKSSLSLVLENKGSVARDHLASERTYLAYVRTSLACANAGICLVQLFTLPGSTNNGKDQIQGAFDLQRFARPVGATVVLLGLSILVLGHVRYFTTQEALVRGFFPPARNSIVAVALVLGAIVGVVFAAMIAQMRG